MVKSAMSQGSSISGSHPWNQCCASHSARVGRGVLVAMFIHKKCRFSGRKKQTRQVLVNFNCIWLIPQLKAIFGGNAHWILGKSNLLEWNAHGFTSVLDGSPWQALEVQPRQDLHFVEWIVSHKSFRYQRAMVENQSDIFAISVSKYWKNMSTFLQ